LPGLLVDLMGDPMAKYFTGDGETLLACNERMSWRVRFGYALSRCRPLRDGGAYRETTSDSTVRSST